MLFVPDKKQTVGYTVVSKDKSPPSIGVDYAHRTRSRRKTKNIYIYMSVCVCVCICFESWGLLEGFPVTWLAHKLATGPFLSPSACWDRLQTPPWPGFIWHQDEVAGLSPTPLLLIAIVPRRRRCIFHTCAESLRNCFTHPKTNWFLFWVENKWCSVKYPF